MFQSAVNLFKQKPLFLALLPAFFIYSGYNELFGFLSVPFMLKNTAWVVVGIALLYLLAQMYFRNQKQATVFTFFLAAFVLLFGFLHDLLKQAGLPKFVSSYTLLLPLILTAVFLFAIWLKRISNNFTGLYLYLNLLLLALVLSEIPNSIKRYHLDRSVHNLIDFRFSTYHEFQAKAPVPDSAKPDIYFLIFDALGSTRSLKESLNKDNSMLDSFLQRKGFYVVGGSRANYNWTIHSISTTLNMQYLPDFIAPVMNDPKVYFWGSASILNNSLTVILKAQGYQVLQYQPISFSNPDWPFPSFFNDLKSQHYFFKTLPGRIYKDIFWNYTRVNLQAVKNIQTSLMQKRSMKRKEEVETTLRLIKETCSPSGKPRFVYAHFMLPHDPYTFDRHGNIISINPRQPVEEIKDEPAAYFEQVLYANSIIEDVVTYIRTHNRKNSVIIVAGDHGYKYYQKQQAAYSFQNLNAIYFPDGDFRMLYDSVTPVNTFRILLNKYLGSSLPLLKDSSILVTEQKETINRSKKIGPVRNLSNPARQ